MRYWSLWLVLCPLAGWVGNAQAQEALEFDTDTLKRLGLSSQIGDYFSQETRFMPGVITVDLVVNGAAKGVTEARFNQQGELCAGQNFLLKAGVVAPGSMKDDDTHCYDLRTDYPTSIIKLLPGEGRVELVVPQDALTPDNQAVKDYSRGGTAGFVNYTLLSSLNEFDEQKNRYAQATLNTGINVNDWMLRSGQILTRMDGQNSVNRAYSWAEKTLVDKQAILQLGEINTNNPLISGAPVYGVQVAPDSALEGQGSGAVVSGIANTPQARVEIRQQGMLIYSTLVPAGPFELTDIPIISNRSDLEVKVIETNGESKQFTLTAAAFMQQAHQSTGYTLSLGKVHDTGSLTAEPWVVSGSGNWNINRYLGTSEGFFGAEKYQSLALSFNTTPLESLSLDGQVNLSRDSQNDKRGQSYTLSSNYAAPADIDVSLSTTHYSRGYRDFMDTLSDDDDVVYTKADYTASLGWSADMLGSFSFSYSMSEGVTSDDDSRNISLNWSQRFTYASVNVGWQHLLSNSHDDDDDDDSEYNSSYSYDDGDTLYVNVSIPLGQRTINSWFRRDNGNDTYGTSTRGDVNDSLAWNLSAERDQQEQENTVSGGINSNLHYTQLGLNGGTSNQSSRNYSATLSGGLVAHKDGLTFSPYAVQDTFAIVSTQPHLTGMKLATPQGDVWTDVFGRAVIPGLSAYQPSRVEVDMTSLPRNVDINNGTQMVNQGRGSVGQVTFSTLTQRRAILNVSLPDGKLLPKGVAISDLEGNYVTTSVDDGVVFINNISTENALVADNYEASHSCRINFSLPDEPEADAFYESANVVCTPDE